MKASTRSRGWQSLVGVLAVGALAFGLSIAGAADPMPSSSTSPSPKGDKESLDRSVVPTLKDDSAIKARGVDGRVSVEGLQRVPAYAGAPITHDVTNNGHFGRILRSEIPIMPVQIVNPFDDEFTRARMQGVTLDRLTGLPVGAGGVASPQTGCSFDIDCDDCNPCTDDFCNILPGQPLGSGTCVNTPLPDGSDGGCGDGLCCNGRETCQGGVCETPGNGTGIFDPAQGCEFNRHADGTLCQAPDVCDEFDGKCKPKCDSTNFCAVSGAACTTSLQCDQSIQGNFCKNCNDGLLCNGTETCSAGGAGNPPVGVCKRGTNPCGDASATCGEKKCSIAANNPLFCTTDGDCTGGGTCSVVGPICFPGRCCVGTGPADPTCGRRAKSITYQGIPSCNSVSGIWYPGDKCDPTTKACSEGDLTNPNTGAACPTGASNAFSTKCPKYGAGIAPITNFNTDVALVIGPFSRSATCDHFDIGDDYTFSNNSFMAIDHLRWIGGGGARLVWEMRDASGNLIEDTVTLGVGGFGLYTLLIDPPIIVPPSGYVTVRPAPQFAPNGRTFIAATDVVDIGSNDANALWYDGAIHTGSTFIKECVGGINDGGWCDPVNTGSDCPVPGVCTARNQILAIELEGTKTNEPLGACCNLNSGTCTGNDGWICEGNGGAFLGQGSFCNSCNAGTTLGANCSRCVGGANLNLACQRASDCPGSTCAANASVCANSCTGGAANGAPCLVAGDCPGGVCTVGGNPGSVCNANTACGVGACCNPTTGNCTLVTPTACTTSGGNFQGFGTDCDSDNGHENGQQSCCPQPQKKYCNGGTNNHGVCTTNGNCPGGGTCSANRYPGGDNCEDAIVQPISVAGTTYQDPVVVTISGDNSTASGQDTCGNAIFDITTGPGADPGWWEAFQIDSCAFVRVDFCCSSPTVEPQWSFMYTGCPCNSVVANIADPNVTDESAVARGKPYCDNDDNLWLKFGPLPAGTYYMPVYSVLAGHHGPYQMHITAYACPTAACCAGGNCSVTDFLNCQNTLQGTYLGPPNLPTAVSTCDNTPVTGTCGTGSCCTAPGQCKDQIPNNGPKATEAACLGLGGNPIYHGGIRCKGGSCDNNSNISCNSESDPACGGGHCTGTATEFAQASPCPPCEIQDNAHCQTAGLPVAGARLSDYCVADCVATPSNGGLFVADDFTADVGGNLMKVCFEGIFGDQNTGLGDCSGSNPPEVFEVAIYADRGLPDETNVLGRTSTHVVAKAQIGTGYNPVVPIFRWQVSLDHPIALVQGTKYWISIINNTNKNLGGTPGCDWFWENSQQTEGNHYYVYGQDQIWTAADVLTGGDMGFCLDIANSPPIVPTKACCACSSFPNPSGSDPHCKDLTAEDCATVHGDWLFSLDTCGTHQCQAVGFAGDNCTAAIVAPVPSSNNAYSNSFNNFCANTDGPTNLTCRGANTRFGNDVWYKYTASCTGTLEVSTCDDSGEFDTVMAVYHSVGVCVGGTSAGKNCNVAGDCPGGGTCPANANVCGCPPTNNLGQFGDCNDDGCVFNGAGSKIGPINVTQGECYTIRVAGFNAAQGHGTFHADCVPSGGGPPVVQGVPNQVDKNRYLAFSVPSVQTAAAATSLKVSLISLLHPNPANLNPPPDFSSREGQHWWVELDPSTKTCSNVANHQKSCSSDNDCGGSPGTCVSTPGYCQESETPASTFRCGILQCAATTPRDWAAELGTDPIYVTGPVLVPSSTFVVTNCADPNNCPANTTLCVGGVNNGNACTTDAQCTGGACGDPKFLTQRWGDVFTSFQTKNTCHGGTNANAPCLGDSYCPGGSCKVCVNGTNNGNPCTNKCSGGANNTLPCFTDAECPGGVCAASTQCPGGACGVTLTQPNISDVSAIIDKFKSTSGAIGVAFADLVPATPDHRVNISDVAACVDAFKAIAYPFQLVSFPTCP